jgi:hypothetical protein
MTAETERCVTPMTSIMARVVADIPPARRIGRVHIVPGTGKIMLPSGEVVRAFNVSPDHRAVVGEDRIVRQGAGGRMELETS